MKLRVDTHESIFLSTTSTKSTVCNVIYAKVFDLIFDAEASSLFARPLFLIPYSSVSVHASAGQKRIQDKRQPGHFNFTTATIINIIQG